jgi:peptide/nickel transport system substrate-binding protein
MGMRIKDDVVRVILALVLSAFAFAAPALAEATFAIAMHGEPALPRDFAVMPYADADAPKGGRMVQGVLGTFDSLNPFIVKGLPAQSLRGYVFESLMARGYDEPFSLYGLLARTIDTDDARSYVTFGGAFFRRQAGDGRRRDLFLAALARSRPA